MLEELYMHFHEANPRVLPKWEQHIQTLQLQKNILTNRFLNIYSPESRGFRCLRQVLDQIDSAEIEYIFKQGNDFSRYINCFLPLQRNSNRLFQPVESGRAYRHTFISRGVYSTNEYICAVDDVDNLSTLPLDKNWEEWNKVQPVHLWYHDSQEYSLNLLQTKVKYTYTNPTYAIIFIDVIALLFKYYKYMTLDIPNETEKSIHNFIQNHVYRFFFTDLQDIWLFNQLLICTNLTDSTENISSILDEVTLQNKQYGYLGGRHITAMENLMLALNDVRNGNLRVNSLLSSKLLSTGSLLDRINKSFKYLDVAHIQQLQYMTILRDIPMIDLILQMHRWRIDTEAYRSLARELRWKLRRLMNNRPWSKIYDPVIKNHLKSWLENTLTSIED